MFLSVFWRHFNLFGLLSFQFSLFNVYSFPITPLPWCALEQQPTSCSFPLHFDSKPNILSLQKVRRRRHSVFIYIIVRVWPFFFFAKRNDTFFSISLSRSPRRTRPRPAQPTHAHLYTRDRHFFSSVWSPLFRPFNVQARNSSNFFFIIIFFLFS